MHCWLRNAQGPRGWAANGSIHRDGASSRFCRVHAALLLGSCVAPIGCTLAYGLLLCRCIALPWPFTPSRTMGQRPSPLLILILRILHCPQRLVGRYARASGPSVMVWAT